MLGRNVLLAGAAGIASAVLFYFGTGLHPIWWLLWLGPIPVLAIAPRLPRLATFLVATGAFLIGGLNLWNYFTHELSLPRPLIIISLLIPALLFGLGTLFVRTLVRAGALVAAALALPVYWVTIEYLAAISSPHSTFGNLGYTQMDCLPIIQIASITGIWGVSFIVFLFAGTLAVLLSGAGNPRNRLLLAIAVAAFICVVFVFGEWRLRKTAGDRSVTVTLIGKDVPMSAYLGSEEQALELLRQYADEIRHVTPPGTDVVVLPEKIARIDEKTLPQVDALFSSAASDTHAKIDVGLVRLTSSGGFNSSRFYFVDGTVENYDKHHLLLGVEPEKPGDKRVVLDQPSGHWGLQICKDMDFPKLSREYAGDGANLMLVPAWDFNLDRWLHARMAVLRAIENGFGLARSARNGLLTLSDNRGRILQETKTLPDGFIAITGQINVSRDKTFYSWTGDWFAWACVATFIVLLGSRFLHRTL
jgi:apolipoprotein N-acyltransferase